MFPGVARDRDALSNATVLVLHTKLPSKCEVGVRCKHFCSSDCSECIFFEIVKVSPIFASATFRIRETTIRTMCYCYKHPGRPVIQPSPMWHHGFIVAGTIVTGGKMLKVYFFYFVYLNVLHYDLSNSVFMNVRLFNVKCFYLKEICQLTVIRICL